MLSEMTTELMHNGRNITGIHFALVRYQNLGVLFLNFDPNNLIIYGIAQWIWIVRIT